MSTDLEFTSSGEDGINKIVSAIDRLHSGLERLGSSNTGLDRLAQNVKEMQAQMATGVDRLAQGIKEMQAQMSTGFAELANLAKTGGAALTSATEGTAKKLLTIEQRRDVEMNNLRQKGAADQERFNDRQINADRTFAQAKANMQERQLAVDVAFAQAQAKVLSGTAAARALDHAKEEEVERKWLAMLASTKEKEIALETAFNQAQAKVLAGKAATRALDHAAEEEVERKWLAMLASAKEKEIALETAFNQAQAKVLAGKAAARALDHAKEEEVERKWLAMLAAEREKELSIEAAFNQAVARLDAQKIAEAQATAAKLAAVRAAETEKQRSLNTNFQTSSPLAQIQTARQAQVYAGMGGDATAKYGSAAAALANAQGIRSLEEAHKRLQQTAFGSTRAINDHSHAMNEAHGFARGLAGSLGGLWLTYGSVAPLLAGAAIAGSLKSIVVVGKEVENQLNFVAALSVSVAENGRAMRDGISLSSFMEVTDSSLRSVVESANAMRMLAQNGMNFTQSIASLPAILDLATIGEMNVGQAAIAATGAVSAFGLGMGEVGRVSDIFAKTAASSNTSVIAITESMKQASTVSSLFKVTIEETAGMLGLLAKINITGGAAGTSMTNMLTGLYEPTNKGKKAMEDLGLSTFQTNGQIKPFTQTLEELKMRLAGFNEQARVDFLGSIFTVRGLKAAQLALDNIDQFKQKTEEAHNATGFMRRAVEQLENSSAGAFERLGVTVQNTFVKAFQEASPFVQRIGLDLNHALGGEDTQSAVKNLAANVAQLMGALLDGSSVLAATAVGYVAWRLAASMIGPHLIAASAATVANTTAQAAATAATTALISAQAGGAATAQLFAAATTATAVAQRTAAAATAAWSATLMPFLGALAVALAAGAALWLLFRDNTTAADVANLKISNTIDVVREAIEKENIALEKSNRLWDAKNGRFRSDTDRTGDIEEARRRVTIEENKVKASGGTVEGALRPQYRTTKNDVQVKTADWNEFSDGLVKARQNLAALEQLQNTIDNNQAPLTRQRQLRQEIDSTQKTLQDYAKQAGQTNSKGQLFQPNEAVREGFREAGRKVAELESLKALVADGKKGLSPDEMSAAQERLSQIKTDLAEIKKKESDLLAARPAKPEKGAGRAANAAENTALERLQGDLEARRDLSNQTSAEARRQNARGELGDLALIRAEREQSLLVAQKEIEIARKKMDVNTKGPRDAKLQNELSRAELKVPEISRVSEDREQEIFQKMADEQVMFAAETERRKGNLVDAYNMEYESKNREMLAKLNSDIAEADDLGQLLRLTSFKETLEQMRQAEGDAQLGQQLNAQLDVIFSNLNKKLSEQDERAGGGAGLATIFDSALESAKAYEAALPQMIEKQRALQALADAPGASQGDKNSADRASADLRAAAAKARNVWKDVGADIATSLTNAFGKAGGALGKLLTSTIAYGAKRKQIDADYARADKSDPTKLAAAQQQASRDTASAQISSYAEMTKAAQGFFNEGSKGYIALGIAEKTFRMFELAMMVESAVKKSGLVTAFTSLFVSSKDTETAATLASVGPDVAASEIKGTAAAAAGVAGQAQGDPYTAWARMAAMAAAMAALGFMVSGGSKGSGGGKTAAEVQKTQGTGTVFGDIGQRQADGTMLYKEQSQSIANSLEILEGNSDTLLPINLGMLTALKNIETSMTGLTNLVVRTPGLTDGSNFNIQEGTIKRSGAGAMVLGGLAGNTVGAMAGAAFGLSGMLGALAGPVGLVLGTLVGKLWGKTTQNIVDSGIGIKGSVSQLQSGQGYNQYASVDTTKSSWFGLKKSTNNAVQSEGLTGEIPQQLGLIFTELETALSTAAVAMGGKAADVKAALASLSIDASVSLKGLSGDALTQALNGVISKAMDEMASAAFPEMDKKEFLKVGEGAAQRAIRLANNYAQVDAIMEQLGATFGAVGMSSLSARERLIQLAGGLESIVSQADFFSKNFLTEDQQQAPIKKRLTETLSGISGGAETDTMDEFSALVQKFAGDVSEDGMKAFTTLLRIAPAFKEIYGAADTVGDALKKVKQETKDLQEELDDLSLTKQAKLLKERNALLSEENKLLFDQIQAAKIIVDAKDDLNAAYEAERDAIDETIDRVKTLGSSWKKFRDGLLLGDKSALTPEEKYFEAKSQFEKTLTAARGGDTDAQDRLESAAENFLEASRVSNSSSDTYTSDFNKVLAATDEAIIWAGQQVDIGKESLKALKSQVEELIDIEDAVMSVGEAIKALALAMGKDGKDVVSNAQDKAINSLYQGLLGRDAEKTGLDFWKNTLNSGATIGQVGVNIGQSKEYQDRQGVQALYQGLLGREADKTGLDFWMKTINNNGATLADIAASIRTSSEYQQRQANGEVASATQSSRQANMQAGAAPAQEGPTREQMERFLAEAERTRSEAAQNAAALAQAIWQATQAAAEQQVAATKEAGQEAGWQDRSKASVA